MPPSDTIRDYARSLVTPVDDWSTQRVYVTTAPWQEEYVAKLRPNSLAEMSPEEKLAQGNRVFAYDLTLLTRSNAFKDTTGKQQLFTNSKLFNSRESRATHSLQVANIAKTIAVELGLPKHSIAITEAAALAHDFGHPPFGHRGEQAIDAAPGAFGYPSVRFNHNHAAIRVLTETERSDPGYYGLGLSAAVLRAVAHHHGTALNAEAISALPPAMQRINRDYALQLEKSPSLEAQIAAIADDLAYIVHDTREIILNGNIKIGDVVNILRTAALAEQLDTDMKKTEEKLDARLSEEAKAALRSVVKTAKLDPSAATNGSSEPDADAHRQALALSFKEWLNTYPRSSDLSDALESSAEKGAYAAWLKTRDGFRNAFAATREQEMDVGRIFDDELNPKDPAMVSAFCHMLGDWLIEDTIRHNREQLQSLQNAEVVTSYETLLEMQKPAISISPHAQNIISGIKQLTHEKAHQNPLLEHYESVNQQVLTYLFGEFLQHPEYLPEHWQEHLLLTESRERTPAKRGIARAGIVRDFMISLTDHQVGILLERINHELYEQTRDALEMRDITGGQPPLANDTSTAAPQFQPITLPAEGNLPDCADAISQLQAQFANSRTTTHTLD